MGLRTCLLEISGMLAACIVSAEDLEWKDEKDMKTMRWTFVAFESGF